MFKIIVAAALLTGAGAPCFSQEINDIFADEVGLYGESAPFLCGVSNLFSHDYELALEDFERSSSLTANASKAENQFLVLFGKTIAYDNLNMRSHCEQAIGAMFILAANTDDDDDDDSEDIKANEVIQLMQKMALLTPSADIRKVLQSMVSEDND
ncbi:MAG: hypothetical protein HYX67_15955 [Candidatus Melainabacteria bacterium]|nr:hypothetical protein [Candidatus Melainabacteria bacterium]